MQISQKFNLSKKVVIASLFFILLIGVFLYFGNFVFAATDQFGMNYASKLGLSNKDPRLVIMELVRIALGFVGIIAVIIIMYAGFLWMTSAGNEQKVDEAKKTLVNAVIGLVIILSAFLIVSFIINKINNSITYGPNGPNGGQDRTAGGLAAIGNCAIETVYPEPGQRDVPRNTSIVVTFREAVSPSSIVGNNNLINTGSVRIYKSNDNPPVLISDVTVTTTDYRTFIFTPANYLGSPSENVWYTINLTSDIRKPDGKSVFDKCGFSQEFTWRFEVSNRIDLIPPQVLAGELFPPPDNERDNISGAVAVAARGAVTVNGRPSAHSDAYVPSNGVTAVGPGTPTATAVADVHCGRSAAYTVTMLEDNYAALLVGTTNLGSAAFVGNSITFAGYFTLTAAGAVQGNQWTVDLNAEVLADNINVDGNIYTFISGPSQGSEIQSSADNNTTAANIAAALAGNANIRTERTGNSVAIIARMAGANGNNIALTSSTSTILTITPMAGGVNSRQTVDINDKRDQPRNSIIQINFNEAINPLTVSGDAFAVSNYIKVVNENGGGADGADCASTGNAGCLSYDCVTNICQGDFVSGKFIVSNIYRTVEFISDNLCGVNSCGERIYCLPENSNLRVEVVASPLAGCDNCPAKAPYTACPSGHCYDATNNKNHPLAVNPPQGIVDMAMNSLDGNRDEEAIGPDSFFNENTPLNISVGDSYRWSFFINDIIDLTTPEIDSIDPRHTAVGVNLSDPIRINFSKIMMSASLTTGSTVIDNGRAKISHKLINLWNYSNNPVGFWVAKSNIDNTSDGNADFTQAEIRHSIFADTTSYRAQAGSGVKDIYQNCFSPSAGNYGSGNCPADADNRSCCPNGVNLNAVTVPPGGNCPQ
jgi:hypothetical protein